MTRISNRIRLATALCLCTAAVYASMQVVNRGVEAFPDEVEHPESSLPGDGDAKAEWAFARLRYFSAQRGYYSWGMDAPKSDRQFVQGVRRLTRLDARSVEEVVSLRDDGIFDWPWVYAVEVGYWELSDPEAKRLREYLLKGGFLMVDDFHGTFEWSVFVRGLARVFPDRPIVDIPPGDQILHMLYDLKDMVQVPTIRFLESGRTWERDGRVAQWKAVYDDKGRIMVAICHNQDNGDAWEWADHPDYPEKYASQAYRMGINFLIYSMTH